MPPFIGPINIEVSTLVVGKVEKLKEMLTGALFAEVGYVLKTKILLIDEIVFCKNEGLVLFDKNRIVEWPPEFIFLETTWLSSFPNTKESILKINVVSGCKLKFPFASSI